MPRKNSIKRYYENGYYHVYNRGVEKRNIFIDRDDYVMFLHLLKTALSNHPKQGSTLLTAPQQPKMRERKNFYSKINLLAYCLMPNHFHLLLKQTEPTSMTDFLHSICTAYGMYFNQRYHRVGSLFQGIFKAVDIEEDNYLLWVSRYIHRNPSGFQSYSYSSYGDYLNIRNTDWVNTSIILDYFANSPFRKTRNYQRFVDSDSDEPIDLSALTLDDLEEEY